MPFSNRELAPVVRDYLTAHRNPTDWTLLDLGAGAGTYADEVGDLFTLKTAVEVWEPYVEQFGLRQKYDYVLVGDIRSCFLPHSDVVIMGDVLEHFDDKEADFVWHRALHSARDFLLLSIPVIPYPQGAEFGNPHEIHRSTWTHERCLALPGVTECIGRGEELGVYVARHNGLHSCNPSACGEWHARDGAEERSRAAVAA